MKENETSTTGGDFGRCAINCGTRPNGCTRPSSTTTRCVSAWHCGNTELDDVRGRLRTLRRSDTEMDELRSRIDTAERRAAEMEHEVERLESELDYTQSRFHLTKLTEALRELDNDVVIEEDDDLYDHPRVTIGQPTERVW